MITCIVITRKEADWKTFGDLLTFYHLLPRNTRLYIQQERRPLDPSTTTQLALPQLCRQKTQEIPQWTRMIYHIQNEWTLLMNYLHLQWSPLVWVVHQREIRICHSHFLNSPIQQQFLLRIVFCSFWPQCTHQTEKDLIQSIPISSFQPFLT